MTNAKATGPFDPATVAALIPCYREEAHIADVVAGARKHLQTVMVVDDGSPDQTADRARQAGAEVIVHAKNAGKGAAIKTGFRALLDRGFEFVLIMDGDGQHLPEEIARFLDCASHTQADVYVGNRMHDTAGMPRVRYLTNKFMSWIISRLCGQEVPDSQCGFRMIHRSVIPLLFCESNAYDYETEMLLIASRANHRIAPVPVSTVYANEKSKIRPIRDAVRFFKLIARYQC